MIKKGDECLTNSIKHEYVMKIRYFSTAKVIDMWKSLTTAKEDFNLKLWGPLKKYVNRGDGGRASDNIAVSIIENKFETCIIVVIITEKIEYDCFKTVD